MQGKETSPRRVGQPPSVQVMFFFSLLLEQQFSQPEKDFIIRKPITVKIAHEEGRFLWTPRR